LLSVITGRHLEHLCLRKIQLLGSEEYQGSIIYIFDFKKNITLPDLVELDFSDNMITHIPSSFVRIIPKLQIIDFSGNLLVHITNMANVNEILMLPEIHSFNFDYQGTPN
jgi:Leucine-rich repeat (LRR) protein